MAKPDFSALQSDLITMAYTTETAQTTLSGVLSGTGWTAEALGDKKRTTTLSEQTRYSAIYKIADTFKLEIEFDIENKVIRMAEKLGVDLGEIYIHDQVNLIQLNTSGDSYDVYTRIIPRGRDGQGIESVNGGLDYLDNFQHTNKVKPFIWEDGRYTNLEQLKADALEILEDVSKPRQTYAVNVINLYKKDPAEWAFLAYKVGDHVDLISNVDGVDVKQRIIATETYLDGTGERDSITIQNLSRDLNREGSDEFNEIRQATENIRAQLNLLEDGIEAKVNTYITNYVESSDLVTNQDLADEIADALQPFNDAIDDQNTLIGDLLTNLDTMNIDALRDYMGNLRASYLQVLNSAYALEDKGGVIQDLTDQVFYAFTDLENFFITAISDGKLTDEERQTFGDFVIPFRDAVQELQVAITAQLSAGIGILTDEISQVRQEITGDSIINEVAKTEIWRDTVATIPDMDDIGGLIDEKIVDYGTHSEQIAEGFRREIYESITENNELITSRTRYFSETINGLEIGLEGSPFATLINEKKLAFLQSGSAVAYVQHNRMVIADVVARVSLQMGEHKFESYAGNLTIARWVGPFVEED